MFTHRAETATSSRPHNVVMLIGLTPQRRRLLIGALVLVAALAAGFVFSRTGSEPPLRASGPVPVVLVHGFGGDSSSMAAIQARLQREGLQVISLDLPNGGTGDIVDSAKAVADAVDDTRSSTVDLIGFSMGGLVIRAYLEHHDGLDRARHVVTLGSPHHGTNIAGAAAIADPGLCVDACDQMTPGSAFLEELNEPDETPPGPSFVTVWTSLDETVIPPETATLDGAVNVQVQSVCPGSTPGHGDLPRDPMVLGLIVRALRGELVATPGPAACQRLTRLGS